MDVYAGLTVLMRFLDPERAHGMALWALRTGLGPRFSTPRDDILRQQLWDLSFDSPIGLAAGFDKDARAPEALLATGFGFVEIGTVTPMPQAGNPRPRLFRLPQDQAIINRMGFNNDGLAAAADRLRALPPDHGVIGVNLGANKDSADRIADYTAGVSMLGAMADYLVINVSSPNTPGLRDLQAASALRDLLDAVLAARAELPGRQPPVLLKLAPDVTDAGLADIAEILLDLKLDGAIISNTTIGLREQLSGPHHGEGGGLSGRPLFDLSTEVLAKLYRLTGGALPLIGVGGVTDGRSAYEKIINGASLVQIYTAMIYHGPGLARRVALELAALLRANGFSSLSAAVGSAVSMP